MGIKQDCRRYRLYFFEGVERRADLGQPRFLAAKSPDYRDRMESLDQLRRFISMKLNGIELE